MVCLNHELRAVDRASNRLSLRLARAAARDLRSVDALLTDALTSVMMAAHEVAVSAEIVPYALSLEAALGAEQRASMRKFYASIARSATDKTMTHVREKLLADVESIALGKGRRKSIGTAMTAAGVSRENPALFKTLLKTHSAMAFNAAAWTVSQGNDKVWGYEYVTAGDDHVRHEHAELDGARYAYDHQFWDTYAPPNGWNCRCTLRPIMRGTSAARLRAVKKLPKIDADFRFNAGKMFSAE